MVTCCKLAGEALYLGASCTAGLQVPIRIEMVDAKQGEAGQLLEIHFATNS